MKNTEDCACTSPPVWRPNPAGRRAPSPWTSARVESNVRIRMPHSKVKLANLREEATGTPDMQRSVAHMSVKPFEIVTLKIVP